MEKAKYKEGQTVYTVLKDCKMFIVVKCTIYAIYKRNGFRYKLDIAFDSKNEHDLFHENEKELAIKRAIFMNSQLSMDILEQKKLVDNQIFNLRKELGNGN